MSASYLPHTEADRRAMLAAMGIGGTEELFVDIPSKLRLDRILQLPPALSEMGLLKTLQGLAAQNGNTQDYLCFLGGGAYDHYIPSVVGHVTGRSEFYTAYTQYQPEISQGYLQALWEYQSMICELTGMEAANASMYDGGTALAEAAMMAAAATGRKKIVISGTVHPHYQAILATYARDLDYTIVVVEHQNGMIDLDKVEQVVDAATAAVLMQSPNFFGCVEDVAALAKLAHGNKALLVTAVDPISLGIIEPPGKLGADIVVGEGQALGIPMSFGGPYLGFFAATEKLLRKMPGRIVGQTTDHEGTRGFVLTLQAREQHIRRQKANSNICSNEALCALSASVYLSAVGKQGLRQIAELCLQKAHYAQDKLSKLPGCSSEFNAPFFKEFVIRLPKPVADINAKLLSAGIIGGLDLGAYDPQLQGCMLVCVTEKRSREEIDQFVARLGELL